MDQNQNNVNKLPNIFDMKKKIKNDLHFEKQYDTLINFDQISPDDEDRKIIFEQIIQNKQYDILSKESKALGCFIGLACGDALGAISDNFPFDYQRNEINGFNITFQARQPIGLFTDDTSSALCLADSLLENNLQLNCLDYKYRNSSEEYVKNEGFGEQNANGTLMRLAPIPIAYYDQVKIAMDLSFNQSRITHDGLEAAECCALLAYIIVTQINNQINDLREINKALDFFNFETESVKALVNSQAETNFKFNTLDKYNKLESDRNWNWADQNFKYSETRSKNDPTGIGIYALDALAMALHIVYFTMSFKEAIIKAVNLGGDADTLAAIVGQIAGSKYGLNQEVLNFYQYIRVWDEDRIIIRGYKLFHKHLINLQTS